MTEQDHIPDLTYEQEYAEDAKKEMNEWFDQYNQESIRIMDKEMENEDG